MHASSASDKAADVSTVGVGVPVYNAEAHLPRALDALLAQSFGDFEILVSDNASTDATYDICLDYARRDARVRCVRQPRNVGLAANWNFVAHNSRGRYFKWASGNDFVAADMLASCVQALERDAGAVLAFGRTQLVDDGGALLQPYDGDFAVLDESPAARFRTVCDQLALNNAISGLIRRTALIRTGLVRTYPPSDAALMAELALLGKFVLLPQRLLFRSCDPSSMSSHKSMAEVVRLHDPSARRVAPSYAARKHVDLLLAPLRIRGLSPGQRLSTLLSALRRAVWSRNEIVSALVSRPLR